MDPFAKIIYCLKALTILIRSSILRFVTGCWNILFLLYMSLNATLWHIFVEQQVGVIFLQNISLQLCQWLALWGALHRYLSIICCDDVIFNVYYFIAVPIGKTYSMSLMRFNKPTFYIFFISLLTLSKFSQCFKILMFTIKTVF